MIHDAVIIGGGPVGLTLANLLARRGHSIVVLEKQAQPYPLPRAIHFDGEAMQVFQAAGLADAVLPQTTVGKGMLFKDRSGNTLLDWSRGQVPGPTGWHESYRFYQPGLEAVLRDGLNRFDRAELRNGAEAMDVRQTDEMATARLTTGADINAHFAIAADGATSFTRDHLGIGQHDLGFQERWLVVDARLTRPRPDLGDHSVQFCDPDHPATYVRGVKDWRRWELRLPPDSPKELTAAQVWHRLARWVTPKDATLERHAIYTFRSRIARTWRIGRIFLAGDAAHQMPPFMGQGMCAGLRDAANLAWKISAMLGGAAPDLLDSYQPEREANARAFIEKSVALGQLINQTAQGKPPEQKMHSIWPALGPGLGPRDGFGGTLAPQVNLPDGGRADDLANGHFYALANAPLKDVPLPQVIGAQEWLAQRRLTGVIIRPDGYCLAGIRPGEDPNLATRQALALNAALAPFRAACGLQSR